MGGAGDARVVVADRLLALAGELSGGQVQAGLDEAAQVVFDLLLVLGGGRDDAGGGDQAVGIDAVTVVEDAPGLLVAAVAERRAGLDLDVVA
ncbi:MAG TPA: hypothetical protein VFU17_07585, partial [Candidatus Limnocylindrales bacterium]|nr:hypothetical protein [Candidatus Limnocylindrales bacterium]